MPPAPNRPRWLRGVRQAGGFLLIFTGIPLLITPVPIAPAIVLGLNLLKDDYAFAHNLLERTRAVSAQLRRKFPEGSLRLAQASLRRQMFAPRQWFWRRPPAAAKSAPATPPPLPAPPTEGR